MNPRTVRVQRLSARRPTRAACKSQNPWYAILPNAGTEYAANARGLEDFVVGLRQYFPADHVLSIVDTSHVDRLHDRIYWDRLGRYIVEPYRLNNQLGGVLALDFVLRVNPDASVVIVPKASNLEGLRNTWYMFHSLKRESQNAPGDVFVVNAQGKIQTGVSARGTNGRNVVRYDGPSRFTFDSFWEPSSLLVATSAKTLWAYANKAMPELTRRIVEELRPTIHAVEAGRVDPKHVYLCLMHLYEAFESEMGEAAEAEPTYQYAGMFSGN